SLIAASNIAVYKTRNGETTTDAVARLRWIPEVLHAQPNFRFKPQSNDTLFGALWALKNTGQLVEGVAGADVADITQLDEGIEDSNNAGNDIGAPDAWVKSEGEGVIVAVIDTGVAFNHPDLLANMWDGTNCVGTKADGSAIGDDCNHGYDFEGDDTTPLPTTESHGTHVAGTIAAEGNNNLGTIGVAPKAKIMALKTDFTTEQVVRAIDFAGANGAKVINASFGCFAPEYGWTDTEYSHAPCESPVDYDGLVRAGTSDLMLESAIEGFGGAFVAAALNGDGNGIDEESGEAVGDDHDDAAVHQSKYGFPCDFDSANIICVAATDQSDALAGFSDYGAESVDVGAPGTNILSTIPGNTTFFEEDFAEASPPMVGDKFVVTSDTWQSARLDNGNEILIARGDSADATSITFDLSTSTGEPRLTFDALCETVEDVDGAVLEFWNGTAWDPIGSLTGDVFLSATLSLNEYKIEDFQFRLRWIDDLLLFPSYCRFDNFLVTAMDDGSSEQYAYKAGTSMAAPHVAGVAALVKGYNSKATTSQIKQIVMETGDDLSVEDRAKLAEGKGKRVNAKNALDVFAPRVGRSAEDVVEAQERPLGNHDQKINFSVKDGIAGLPITLQQFEYSIDNGGTWQAPTNGDASLAVSASNGPGDWRDNGYVTVMTEFPEIATSTIILDVAHADLTGLTSVDQNDVMIRFRANDGAVDSPFAISAAFSVDLKAPVATLSGTPDALTTATNASITVGGDEDMVSYRHALDGGALSPVTPIAEPIAISGLTDGVHTLRVIGIDDNGNVQAEADATTFTWTVDTTAGTALLTSKPDVRTNQTSATFVIGGEDVVTYTYQLDGGEAQGPFSVDETIALTDLVEGPHTITVTGIDALDNAQEEPTTYNWVIDTSAAAPTISGAPDELTNQTSATLTIGGDDVVAYRFSLDGGA
ncbi:MAG: S8 family serine peptidase, partial [bacterium]|nr:S8 family serine peptidase [bacterium]